MTTVDAERMLACVRTFLRRAQLATPGQIPGAVAAAAAELGWAAVLYVVDHEQRHLVPVQPTATPSASGQDPERSGAGSPEARGPALQRQAIEGTLAGRAFVHVEPVPLAGGIPGLWVPLLDGVHRLGVLRLSVPTGTDLDAPEVREAYGMLSALAGHLVAAKLPYGDGLERISRTRERTVASELLWSLLPPLTFGCEGLVVSGILEPCYDVAADAFDYNVIGRLADLAVLDATGHDLPGTLLAAVALGALRNSRRERRDLHDTVATMDRLVAEQGRHEGFVTGVVGRIDIDTGRLHYINAGHPSPLLMRHGKVVKELEGGRRPLLGFGEGREAAHGVEQLQRGDCVILYTDGITEARGRDGEFFGLGRLVGHLERSAAAGLPAPETLRRLSHAVLDHQGGVLQDDATLVLAQWASDQEHRYTSTPSPARLRPRTGTTGAD